MFKLKSVRTVFYFVIVVYLFMERIKYFYCWLLFSPLWEEDFDYLHPCMCSDKESEIDTWHQKTKMSIVFAFGKNQIYSSIRENYEFWNVKSQLFFSVGFREQLTFVPLAALGWYSILEMLGSYIEIQIKGDKYAKSLHCKTVKDEKNN